MVKIFVSSQTDALQATCHLMKCIVINDVKPFVTVYCGYMLLQISNLFDLFNQTLHYKSRCIRIMFFSVYILFQSIDYISQW